MSEYQYYEFQALDQVLTAEAQSEMRRLSSRVQLTRTSASFEYSYSDFRSNPYQILAAYFDAMLYITNWGSRQLMFRFPAGSVSEDVRSAYQYAESLEWSEEGEYLVLNMEYHAQEAAGEWIEGKRILDGMVAIRADILRGDYRALYLAWLKIAHSELEILEEDEDLTEPPVPSGLKTLSPALNNFIDFFDIDRDLISAASSNSPAAVQTDEKLNQNLDLLPDEVRRDFLERLLSGEPNLDITLAKRLRELSGTGKAELPTDERRTILQLVAASSEIMQQRRGIERQQAEAARLKKLELIAQRQEQLWARMPGLMEQKKAKTYDEAINILKDLHELAVHQQLLPQFQDKLRVIRSQYGTSQAFQKRLKEARLI